MAMTDDVKPNSGGEESQHHRSGESNDAPPKSTDRFKGVKLVVAVALLAIAGGKFYVDRNQWVGALAKHPGPMAGAVPDFDLSQTTVPAEEILSGGPGKDGIPALTDPEFLPVREASYLRPDDRVAGVVIEGEARAYPLRILTWHEVVNDSIKGKSIAVTFCPLCDSVAAFDRQTEDGVKEFGVSGLLYNSNVLMYDREGEPEALWSQLQTEAVSGPKAGQSLDMLPVELTTWSDWKERHPETLVLSMQTGHQRDYSQDPYAFYMMDSGPMFPVSPTGNRLPDKARVLGVRAPDGSTKAYPLSAFSDADGSQDIRDEVGGLSITLDYDPEAKSLRVAEAEDGLEWMYSLWFAWYAFYPETAVYPDEPSKADERQTEPASTEAQSNGSAHATEPDNPGSDQVTEARNNGPDHTPSTPRSDR